MIKIPASILNITAAFEVFEALSDLTENDSELLSHAEKAVERAYAPYSNFNVGAALLLANGEIVTGNNQENAAYPSGLCAERVALFYAGSQFPGVGVKAIAVTVKSKTQVISQPVTPCGACRQVIAEYENLSEQPIKIIMRGETGKIITTFGIKNLLPLMFDKQHLK